MSAAGDAIAKAIAMALVDGEILTDPDFLPSRDEGEEILQTAYKELVSKRGKLFTNLAFLGESINSQGNHYVAHRCPVKKEWVESLLVLVVGAIREHTRGESWRTVAADLHTVREAYDKANNAV